MEIKEIIKKCEEALGEIPSGVEKLSSGGSARQYYKVVFAEDVAALSGAREAVFTVGENLQENQSFRALARAARAQGVAVPQIYWVSDEGDCYLQEYIGDKSLLDYIKEEPALGMELSRMALDELVKFQTLATDVWMSAAFNHPFGKRMIMGDLNYFKYCFLKPLIENFDEDKLEDDFEAVCRDVEECPDGLWGFMYRDFQSRNVMVRETPEGRRVALIDFQGGRGGPLLYDVVSFATQARAGFGESARRELIEYYLEKLSERNEFEMPRALAYIDKMMLLRGLQVLGAYGFRGLIEKKAQFVTTIPAALANLMALAERGVMREYPELERVVCELAALPQFAAHEEIDGLQVEVFSFSYKRGYPADYSGNGGGFMFDCRGMHNPGRYDEYKPLTGLDSPVIEFLESHGEVQTFVERALEIVQGSAETYLRRGFDNLQVGFGCTGGRHRSVYCAERFARLLAERYPQVRVVLRHREQGIERMLPEKGGEK